MRRHGSGRTGATNVLRILGLRLASLVALVDIIKGVLPVFLTRHVLFPREPWAEPAAGMGAVVGHTHSPFLKFRGGRGVLTTGGAMLPMNPSIPFIALASAAIPIALTRFISLGSMIGVATQAALALILALSKRDSWQHFAYAIASAVFVIAEHYDNIQRLLSGTERKLGEKVEMSPEAAQTARTSSTFSLPTQVR